MQNQITTNHEPQRGVRRHLRTTSRLLGVGLLFTLIGMATPASAVPPGGGPGGGSGGGCTYQFCKYTFLPISHIYLAQCIFSSWIAGYTTCSVSTNAAGNQTCTMSGFQTCNSGGGGVIQ